jgi:hypothetical protein
MKTKSLPDEPPEPTPSAPCLLSLTPTLPVSVTATATATATVERDKGKRKKVKYVSMEDFEKGTRPKEGPGPLVCESAVTTPTTVSHHPRPAWRLDETAPATSSQTLVGQERGPLSS